MASKSDIELARINASRDKTVAIFTFAGTFFRIAGAVIAVALIMDGLDKIVLSKPDSILALAKVAQAINPSNITGYFLALGVGAAWKYERSGKKRAIQKYASLKRKYEPGELSSGLTDTGDTPADDEV